MVFLAAIKKDDPHFNHHRRWCGDSHWNWNNGEQLQIICYTNCEEAELFINEKSLGTKKLNDSQGHITWDSPFEEGTLKVVAKGHDGTLCSYELSTASKPEKIAITCDSRELKADGQDIAHIELQITDENGKSVYLADDLIKLSIEGPGEIIGIENGDAQDLQPYSSKERKAYHGKLLAYIRTKNVAGQIIVKAESQGLESAQIAISTIGVRVGEGSPLPK